VLAKPGLLLQVETLLEIADVLGCAKMVLVDDFEN